MAYDEVVIAYAKSKFFELNDDGTRLYTYPQIAQMTREHFRDNIDPDTGERISGHACNKITDSTVHKWANDKKDVLGHSWNEVYKKTMGMQKKRALKEIDVALDNAKFADQIKDIGKFRYGMASAAIIKGWGYLLSQEVETPKEAQWLIEMGTKELERLRAYEEQKNAGKDTEQEEIFKNLMKMAQSQAERRSEVHEKEIVERDDSEVEGGFDGGKLKKDHGKVKPDSDESDRRLGDGDG